MANQYFVLPNQSMKTGAIVRTKSNLNSLDLLYYTTWWLLGSVCTFL